LHALRIGPLLAHARGMIRRGPNIVFSLPVQGRPGGVYVSNDAIPVLHPGRKTCAPSAARARFDAAMGATAPIGIGKRIVRPSALIAAALSLSN
jgi:hypothetical protein